MEEEHYSVNLDIYSEDEKYTDSFCLSLKNGTFTSDIDDSEIYLNKVSHSNSQLITSSSNENKDQSPLQAPTSEILERKCLVMNIKSFVSYKTKKPQEKQERKRKPRWNFLNQKMPNLEKKIEFSKIK